MKAGTRLIDVNAVSGMTGFSEFTIRKMARDGRLPAVKVGRFTRFHRDDIEAWLAKLPSAST